MGKLMHEQITEKIIKSFYTVYNELGFGFLEKVYHNALIVELRKNGLEVESQKAIKVNYKGENVGEYFADIIVNNSVIVELKACETLIEAHELQLLNYLRATKIEVGLLLNFGPTPEFRRKIFANHLKKLAKEQNPS